MARGRDTGVPSLNAARRKFYAETGNSALEPYESWADFGLGIRHPESLVNFIAAYGTHDDHHGRHDAEGQARRGRARARRRGRAAGPARLPQRHRRLGERRSDPGLDDVDFWIGGLAEKQMPFGGLLGSTFNFVFETQMEKLQDGDRFYYLSRTAGLNFLTQLEENSFAELVMRNTDAKHLPHDVFSLPDFTFELERSARRRRSPTTRPPRDESELLERMPDGTFRYTGGEHVVWAARRRRQDARRARATTRSGATAATTASRAAPATTRSTAATATTSSPTCSATTSSRAATATTRSTPAAAST